MRLRRRDDAKNKSGDHANVGACAPLIDDSTLSA